MNDIPREKSLVEQRRSGFQPGVSGNPAGRPRKNTTSPGIKSMTAVERLLAKGVVPVAETVLRLAKEGDMAAAKLVLDRVAPPRKGRLTLFNMPEIKSLADLAAAHNGLLSAVSKGLISSAESVELSAVLDKLGKALEASETEARLARLEKLSGLDR